MIEVNLIKPKPKLGLNSILTLIDKWRFDLRKKTVGVLGLTFKAETDDIRDSLSIKLVKLLKLKKIKTLQSDEFYKNKKNISKNDLVKKSDIIILATPHKAYKRLKIKKNKTVVDIWGLIENK